MKPNSPPYTLNSCIYTCNRKVKLLYIQYKSARKFKCKTKTQYKITHELITNKFPHL